MENLLIFSPLFAYILDCLLKEPKPAFHPVCCLGNLSGFLEKKLLGKCRGNSQKFLAGIFCSAVLCLVFALIPLLVYLVIKKYRFPSDVFEVFSFFYASVILYICIAPNSLLKHIQDVQNALKQKSVPEARKKLSLIVGRNTQHMDESDIIRASIESLSENSVDSTIASYFWFCAGYAFFSAEGAITLTVLHRIFNTLDAMWGKKNDTYLYFGKFAARCDDVLNFIPARITFYFIIISCCVIKKCDCKNAMKIGKKYRSKHASPNSAWAEAPYAGALNLKLAGPVYYGDFFCDYPYLGEGSLHADASHLSKAVEIFYGTLFLTILSATFFIASCFLLP